MVDPSESAFCSQIQAKRWVKNPVSAERRLLDPRKRGSDGEIGQHAGRNRPPKSLERLRYGWKSPSISLLSNCAGWRESACHTG
jgi:hypothetical protein